MRTRRGWQRIAALAGGSLVVALLAAAMVVAFDARRWWCKSQAELERTRPPAEVVASFADAGVELEPARLPRVVVRNDRPYRGASAYRYDSDRATLWILVCRARCRGAPAGLDRPRDVGGRRLRQFSALGNNIAIFTTDNDRRSGRQLQARVQHVVDELDVAEHPTSRCYIR